MIATFYDKSFTGDERFTIPVVERTSRHAFHLYPLQIDFSKTDISKRELFNCLSGKGIHCQVHYIPVHLQPYYSNRYGYRMGDFPIAEEFYRREISIPIYPSLHVDDLEYVSGSIKNLVGV
jgi:dTDP-4-amino-4,6-dideoxygalactose transaminase